MPVLFVLFGFELYTAILLSLLIDCGNALVMTAIGIGKREIDIRRGLSLTAFAVFWILFGIYLGRSFLPQNMDLFRGSAGFVTLLIGIGFFCRGIRIRNGNGKESIRPSGSVIRPYLIYAGVAIMAFQVGLIGIGGGMGYAIFLMLCLSYPTLKATGTAMFMTFFSTLVAVIGISFLIGPAKLLTPAFIMLVPLVLVLSMAGTGFGASITHRLPEHKVNFLIGGVVVAAGLLAALQKYYMFQFPAVH